MRLNCPQEPGQTCTPKGKPMGGKPMGPPVQPAHHSSPCLQPPSSPSSYFLGARWTPITGPSITRGLTGSYALPLIGVDLLRVLAFYGQGCTPPRTSFTIGPG